MVIMMIPSVALAQQTPAKPPAKLTPYRTIDSAACSGDATVWVDSAARVYYLKGDKPFGKTKRGGYNCRKQADAAGYRASKSRWEWDDASGLGALPLHRSG
jgi:hypothetical protein